MDNDNDKPTHPEGEEQGALFDIEGPCEDGCVWLRVDNDLINLGPKDAVADRLYTWLASIEE